MNMVTLVIWFRALFSRNFYNWNLKDSTYSLMLIDKSQIKDFNVNQTFVVHSVNRTTGVISGDWEFAGAWDNE